MGSIRGTEGAREPGRWVRRRLGLAALPVAALAALALTAAGPAQAGPVKAGPVQASSAQASSAQASPAQASPALRGTVLARPVAGGRLAVGTGIKPAASFPGGTFSLLNFNAAASGADRCLGIASNRDAGLWNCTYQDDQAWHQGKEYGSTGYYQLINAKGQCLGVTSASKTNGARLVGWGCLTSHRDQYWTVYSFFTDGGTDWYSVKDLNSGKVAGVKANQTGNGSAVVQWTYQDQPNNQFWAFVAD